METPTAEATGLLLVDKPAGITSHDVIAIVRRAIGSHRVGHAGTLDPFATGLLVVLTGRGTRLIPYIDGEPKVYEATIRLGVETDTDDAAGAPVRGAEPPSDAAISAAVAQLTGEIEQIPPAYSAKQVSGVRAYAAARRGAPLDLQPVRVTVNGWRLNGRDGDRLEARITCSGGTYIRALARDLGRLSNSAAHLSALRRVRSGAFAVDDAITMHELRAGIVRMRPLRDAIPSLPIQQVDSAELTRVLHGNSVEARTAGTRVALVDTDDALVAIASRVDDELRPKLVLRDV
jgi:tRNA pseudouridine55 synthase